ncbi:MAG TPA: sulfatase-like hydrolase/transferase [Thermomicrobiales bacterium]|nr:sulfatase-like hydrolase/transferase [Thermomicrobiales bacterium]
MAQPNIVLIVSDQHRADWLGCAGHPAVRTPHLDGLTRDGVWFTHTYCNAPLCVPSRMSMLAGRHPCHTGVYFNDTSLPSDMPTFAHALGLAGYETVLCGRMHFVGIDQRHGYQRRLVGDITPSYPGGPRTAYGHWEGTQAQGPISIERVGPGDSPVLRYDEAVTRGGEAFLAERAGQSHDRPFFLTVGFYGPHPPFVCPPEYYEAALAALHDAPPLPRDPAPRHPWLDDWFVRLRAEGFTDEQILVARANYAGMVNRLDELVGRILTAARSLSGDTQVIYLSDHGEMAGDRGMFWKQSYYEGAMRVPLIWAALAGGGIARGRRVDAPVSLVDLASTLAGQAGAPPLPATDGADLSPLLRADLSDNPLASWTERPVFAEGVTAGEPVRLVRQGRYKLIYYHGYSMPQLFDLAEDPYEQHDLCQSVEHTPVREHLLQLALADWNPEAIKQTQTARQADARYIAQWGRTVGMGTLDLWEQG